MRFMQYGICHHSVTDVTHSQERDISDSTDSDDNYSTSTFCLLFQLEILFQGYYPLSSLVGWLSGFANIGFWLSAWFMRGHSLGGHRN